MSIKNISDWTKNTAEFKKFENTYSNGSNTLVFTGGGGCERIYFPVNVTQGISLTFSLKFCSPTGFTCQYGDNKDYIAITKAVPSGSGQITDFQILGRTAVSSEASSVLREYSVTVTPNYSGIAYLVIDMGYMTDNVQTELIYSDISAKIDYDWNIIDGEITNRNFISMPEKYMEKPYPAALWRIDPAVNNGYPYHELLLFEPKSGAFMNASNLQTVYIPRTCKKIGEWAFRNTALKKVCIAADCTYYPTSFPDGCEIEFYGGGGDYEQLYDSENNMLLDSTGAMIFVRSDD